MPAIYRGDWGDAAREGRLFTGNSAAAGIVLPIYSATAQLFGWWNQSHSGVNMILVDISLTYVDTTGAAGGYCLGLLRNAGSNMGTAAPISAFTDTTAERGTMGTATGGNRVKFTGSAATVTTALMVIGRQLGVSQTVLTAADATNIVAHTSRRFSGEVQLAPGNAMFLCGNIATLSKWAVTATWVEDLL